MLTFALKRRAFTGLAFCFLVLWIGARADAVDDGARWTFCAYNLKNWLTMERYVDGQLQQEQPKPESEKKSLLRILRQIQPDVLGVCEIGSEEDLRDFQQRLRDESGVDLPHVLRTAGSDATRSLALLSRFPILSQACPVPAPTYQLGEQVLSMQRGILDATVQLSETMQVRFVGVHLKSQREVAGGEQALMRRNEAHLLRLHLDRIFRVDQRVKLLCYGDFNADRLDPSIAEVSGSRASEGWMTDLRLRDVNGQVWTHFWEAAEHYSRLDYVFTSRQLRPCIHLNECRIHHVRDFLQASDHRPLVILIHEP
jgi:endonuclease/exonuclease/phosphatase family metal-dependent hydrolase